VRMDLLVPTACYTTPMVDGVVPSLPLRPLGRLQVLAIFGRVPSR
jgi:hypothetical protein